MTILVISCSLNSESRSRALAREAFERLRARDVAAEYLDLRVLALPQCDGEECYEHPAVKTVAAQIQSATAVVLAVPIYNYDANAAAKNLIELTGGAWTGKTVGFACAAGGNGSYMGVLGLANSLMLDFRCVIVPRFVYAESDAFDGEGAISPDLRARVHDLIDTTVRFTTALAAMS